MVRRGYPSLIISSWHVSRTLMLLVDLRTFGSRYESILESPRPYRDVCDIQEEGMQETLDIAADRVVVCITPSFMYIN